MNPNFYDFMQKYLNLRVAVAVSGGVDSMALMHMMRDLGMDMVVLHVNHHLRPSADSESEYIAGHCREMGIPCHVLDWVGDKPATGVEDAARRARYNLMTTFCRENGIGYLFIAHQADDQIETFLLNLARGSGIFGLAGMRRVTVRDGINIVRPMLDISRAELQRYCDARGLSCVYDEMNDDEKYTRVRMRKNRRAVAETLGISDGRILLAMENLGRVRDAMDAAVTAAVSSVMTADGRAIFSDSFLFDLDPDIRLKFIAMLIEKIGGGDYQPRLRALQRAEHKLHTDTKFTLGGCIVRRVGERILIAREGTSTSFRTRHENGYKKQEK